MKNVLKLVCGIFIFLLIININKSQNAIITSAKSVETGNEEVTDRDLALLASLAYENVPNDGNYDNSDVSPGTDCSYRRNIGSTLGWKETSGNCYFKTLSEGPGTVTINNKPVLRYIEGLSERKKNPLTFLLTAKVEEGSRYYFLKSVPEEQYRNWYINNYYYKNHIAAAAYDPSGLWQGQLYAITFKKGDNYVISYRGTDFPDALEWLVDFSYLTGTTEQSTAAYDYAQSEYRRILSENPNAKIYVTGHSLGAYLAQLGGAAINELEQNNQQKKLQKVVYFNGMGIDLVAFDFGREMIAGKTLRQLGDLLIDLATTPNSSSCQKKINWSTTKCSSGRLVLYRTDGDIVSGLGLHYGEIKEVKASADAVSNHINFHNAIIPKEAMQEIDRISTTIKNFIKNFITKILPNSVNGYDEEKLNNGTFSEQLFATVSMFENINLKNNNLDNNDYSNQVVTELDPHNTGFFKTGLRALADVAQKVLEYARGTYGANDGLLANVIEAVNIGHETDSLVCLINNNEGIPTISDFSSSANSRNVNGIRTFYTNKNSIVVSTDTQNGCVYNYSWKEKTSNQQILNGKNNTVIISSPGRNQTKTYEVTGTYGNEIATRSLNIAGENYSYVNRGNVETVGRGTIKKEFAITFDKTAPTCTINKDITTVEEKGKVEFQLTCNEEMDDGTIKIRRLIGKEYISGNIYCNKKTCNGELIGEKRGTLTLNNISHTIEIVAMDLAGNKSNTIEFENVKWKKTESSSSNSCG